MLEPSVLRRPCLAKPPVGASLLAMDPRTPRSSTQHALSLTSIASKLAPTRLFLNDWGFSVSARPGCPGAPGAGPRGCGRGPAR
ncbi:hypothetical protein C1Y31_29530 [Pseudomonas sp. FW305-25]|nr:hypothetical protein C1Y31_29530 [Pseudomonas sp. FW305-25]PMY61638.1 hypothetical protein C1Y32_29350 [Pseudomonas sp. FW126-L8]PNA72096.1 hypothetical protein C1Y33_28585 [Pseudomonas sp. FW305-76]